MKKISFDKTHLVEFTKNHLYLAITIVLFISIIWNLIFIVQQITPKTILPSQIISQGEQINQGQYDNVIAKDNKKKENKINFNAINNPF